MKEQLKKWTRRLLATGLLIIGLLAVIILNPSLTYAHATKLGNCTVYSHQSPDPALFPLLDSASMLVSKSEWFDPNLHLDICLNDGSAYPGLVAALRGRAFAWGFYDKVVLQGKADYYNNRVELNGYRWNLAQLLAHEMIHCFQFNRLGLWKSNPVAQIPVWKWEGYAECIARQQPSQQDLAANIRRYQHTNAEEWAIKLDDGSICPRNYYLAWIMVQYAMTIKHQTYRQLLDDPSTEAVVMQEMFSWMKENESPAQ